MQKKHKSEAIVPSESSLSDEIKRKDIFINALNEEVLRRDRIIDELKKENEILLKLSLKHAEQETETKKMLKKSLLEKNKTE